MGITSFLLRKIYFNMVLVISIFFIASCSSVSKIEYLTDLGASEYSFVKTTNSERKYLKSWNDNSLKDYVIEYLICSEFGCMFRNRTEVINSKVNKFCIYTNGECTASDNQEPLTIDKILSISSSKWRRCELNYNKTLGLPFSYFCGDDNRGPTEDHYGFNGVIITLFGSGDKSFKVPVRPVSPKCIYGEWEGYIGGGRVDRIVFDENNSFKIFRRNPLGDFDNVSDTINDYDRNKVIDSGVFEIDENIYPYRIKLIYENKNILYGLYKCLDKRNMNLALKESEWPDEIGGTSSRFIELKR